MSGDIILEGPDVAPRVRCCGCTGGDYCARKCHMSGGCECHGLKPYLGREPTDDEIRAAIDRYKKAHEARR